MRMIIPAIVLIAAVPLAAEDDVVVTMTIDYDDLDLSSSDDLAALDDRIQQGARRACRRDPAWSASKHGFDKKCARALTEAAFAEVESKSAEQQLASN